MSDATKSARSIALTKAWARRRAETAAAKAAGLPTPEPNTKRNKSARSKGNAETTENEISNWEARPTCLCGCGGELVRHKNPIRQKLFIVGHDARLKSTAAKVIRGELPRTAISNTTRELRNRIGFLRTRPELIAAFEIKQGSTQVK